MLSSRLFPVVFAEESYRISTWGEFWLECLSCLADQAPRGDNDPDLRRSWEDLRTERDDRVLAQRCLGAVLNVAARLDKRLVLVVENLNMLFSDIADPDMEWDLRHALQTEPRIVVLASATSRFEGIDHPDRALYDFFVTRTLRPLDAHECARLWEAVSGTPLEASAVRPLQILTGGSPRLLTIVARFGAGLSFRELMDDLLGLVDEHTEYFKSHLESLPPRERRVYLALAELWRPATTREIADSARIDTNKCSAFLKRLADRGVVAESGGTTRRKCYYLTERMYNIYYLLRSRRGQDAVVEALIQFMAAFYGPVELWAFVERLREEVGGHGTDGEVSTTALERLLELPQLDEPAADQLLQEGNELMRLGRWRDAIERWDRVVRRLGLREGAENVGRVAAALSGKADALYCLGRVEESARTCEEAIRRMDNSGSPGLDWAIGMAWAKKGLCLADLERREQALAACERALDLIGSDGSAQGAEVRMLALESKALALGQAKRYEEVFSGRARPAATADGVLMQGLALAQKGHAQEALQRFLAVVQRLGADESGYAARTRFAAYGAIGALELAGRRWGATVDAASRALAEETEGMADVRLRTHALRIVAGVACDDHVWLGEDVQSVLDGLAEHSWVAREVLHALLAAVPSIGLDRMVELIDGSSAANLLLPLSTALHQELGHETHVAQEVDEVAQDIRRSLAKLRAGESVLTPTAQATPEV